MNELASTTVDGGIYLLAAHPAWRNSRVNRRLLAAAHQVSGVDVQDLYASYPDYDIDVAAEQARAAAARMVVLLHPIQWYSMPALQKLWLDDVLTHGWAYGIGGQALQGKDLWLVATTGGPETSYHPQGYNRYFFDAFLPPYEQTAALCGMRFVPPLMLRVRGVLRVERELFESSLRSARTVLEVLGFGPHEARRQAMRFRQHNIRLFEKMYPYHKDRAKLIAVVRQGRRQFEEQMAQERAETEQRRQSGGGGPVGWDR